MQAAPREYEISAGLARPGHVMTLPYGDVVHLTDRLNVEFDDRLGYWGASVLPFSVLPDDNIFFLLGQEQVWKMNGQWCAFGGQHDDLESEVEKVAAREWFEETCGVCSPARNTMFEHLRQGKFLLRVDMCVNHGAPAHVPRKYYAYYVVQVPWQPQAPGAFQDKVQKLMALHTAFRDYAQDLRLHLEQSDAPLFLPGLHGVVALDVANLEAYREQDGRVVADIDLWVCPEAGRCAQQPPQLPLLTSTDDEMYDEENAQNEHVPHVCTYACLNNAQSVRIQTARYSPYHALCFKLEALHQQQQHLLLEENFDHALRRTFDPLNPQASDAEYSHGAVDAPRVRPGVVLGVPCVLPNVLEKQQLKWFSFYQLQNWMRAPPVQENATMRRAFRPVIQLVLDWFAQNVMPPAVERNWR